MNRWGPAHSPDYTRTSLTPDRPADASATRGRDDLAGGPGDASEPRDDGRAEIRDEPAVVAWWAPVDPTEYPLTHAEVVSELTNRGFTVDQARAAVAGYLDDTSREIGVQVHQWGMDFHDVEAITQAHRTAAPPVVGASSAVAVPTPRAAPTADDDSRREQLIRWHTDDQTADAERVDDAPVRALDGHAPAVHAESQGW